MEENVKLKNVSKGKERRQPYSQDAMPKRTNKSGLMKSDLSHLAPPQSQDGDSSPMKKILNEANKIVKIGMEKDHALIERDNTLQSLNEMVDNLRKNMYYLQMEHEKADQNYQREKSHRSELTKRIDDTQKKIESIREYSNILSNSLKQLEADKIKIAEFYELIYQKQEEVETKHSEVENFLKEQDEILKSKIQDFKKCHDKIVSQHAETVSQLNSNLNCANDKLKVVLKENEELEKKVQELQESSFKLEICLNQQQRLACMHEENAARFKSSLKKLKIQLFKYQKLWKQKKRQIFAFAKKNKILKKTLKKTESFYNQCISTNKTLESKNDEWERKFKKYLEQDQTRLQIWDSEKRELHEKLLHKEAEIENLRDKLSERTKNDKSKEVELDKVENELSRMLSENLKLKDENLNLIQENSNKNKIISDLREKINSSDADFISKIEFHKKESKKLQELVTKLEIQLSGVQERLLIEKREKESVISDFDHKFEEHAKVFKDKITDLEKLLEEKSTIIRKMESEKNDITSNGQKSVELLNKQLQCEKRRNQELSKSLENMRESHEDISKQLEKSEKQISDFLEKLANVNALNRALNRTQNELETNVADLRKEIELGKRSYEALQGEHKKAENQLAKMQKLSEENTALKSSVADLKNLLEATKASVEAYKVVIKKLETEKIEAKNAHSEEMSRFKLELAHLGQSEEAAKAAKDLNRLQMETPKKNFEQTDKRDVETSAAPNSQRENEQELVEIEKWQQSSTPPLQSGKKFLSTPRKIYTPQPGFQSLTPIQKKRDIYEFKIDSSVERLNQDKVLKIFNCQKRETKKETNKRSKTKK